MANPGEYCHEDLPQGHRKLYIKQYTWICVMCNYVSLKPNASRELTAATPLTSGFSSLWVFRKVSLQQHCNLDKYENVPRMYLDLLSVQYAWWVLLMYRRNSHEYEETRCRPLWYIRIFGSLFRWLLGLHFWELSRLLRCSLGVPFSFTSHSVQENV